MLKIPLKFIAGLISLAIASAIQHTPVVIDWTQTPEEIQVLVSMSFVALFVVLMVSIGSDIEDE